MNEKHLILSHYDLDGIVSVINVYNIIPKKYNFQYILTGYTSLEKKINNLSKEIYDILWILDLNISKELIAKLPKDKQIIWIDHHHYEYDVEAELKLQGITCKFIYDSKVSASLQTYEFVSNNFNINNKVKELSIIADVYDNWKLSDPYWKTAYAMNDLFWHYGSEKFFVDFRNGFYLNDDNKNTIKEINTERTQYIKDTIKKYVIFNEPYKLIYIMNPECKHTNHFTLGLWDCDYYVILKEHSSEFFSYSIRLYGTELKLTVQELFAIIKNNDIKVLVSGGHKTVGSITVAYEDNEKFLEVLNMTIERQIDVNRKERN